MLNKRFIYGLMLGWALFRLEASVEDELIATLESRTAAVSEKWAACQQLRLTGSVRSVPALAALLELENSSQAARQALEGMPFPEAGTALRSALVRTSGRIRVGILDSLGARGEVEAVPLLSPLLSDQDGETAGAAARALGRIGGSDALQALAEAAERVVLAVRSAVYEGMLAGAEGLRLAGDAAGAATTYRKLVEGSIAGEVPGVIRAAAWRGLAWSEAGQRVALVTAAFEGEDVWVEEAALGWVREARDPRVIEACVARWEGLSVEAQLAVLEAHAGAGSAALDTIKRATESRHPAVRLAGWQALGEMNDPGTIPMLARAMARGEAAEQEAAREALVRLRGPDVREGLLAHLERAEAEEQAGLLRVLGERGDRAAVDVLLRHAGAGRAPVRLAALESLRRLAVAETLTPLLRLAVIEETGAGRAAVFRTLRAVCQANPDRAAAARQVIAVKEQFPAAAQGELLGLLAILGTREALDAVQSATRNSDVEVAREAVRVLAEWPDTAPVEYLLELARTGADGTLRTLALRGAIEVAENEPDLGRRLEWLERALAAAARAEERRQALGQIGRVATLAALRVARTALRDDELVDEAGLAALAIARELAVQQPALAAEVAVEVLGRSRTPLLVQRAWALRRKPGAEVPFLRDWRVAGPYRKAGVTGATALFEVPFGPEVTGGSVEWRPVPSADQVNLAALFPGEEHCVAYLWTRVVAPGEIEGLLLMGSDDGLQVWLNGVVVHRNNVDRGLVVDQDMAAVRLVAGANDLVLKVTQGGGGWAACVRLAGLDGEPIEGLKLERPAAESGPGPGLQP